MKVYLCGPIYGCSDEQASGWRDEVKEQWGQRVSFLDPMDRDYRGRELGNYQEIVVFDKADIKTADAVLLMYREPSVGSSMEVLFAWNNGKRVFVVNQSGGQLSPWLIYHSHYVTKSVVNAMKKIMSLDERIQDGLQEIQCNRPT